jgi:23S rRNA pseudouridine1911/1915/1917 synthase
VNQDNSILTFQVLKDDAGARLDAFLAGKVEDWSRVRLKKLIDEGDVTVNSESAKSSYKLRENDEIEIELVESDTIESFEPEDIPLEIIYEDEFFAIIDKKAGMVVHPGAGVKNGTLANAVAFRFNMPDSIFQIQNSSDEQSKIQNLRSKIGIVHRLDKDTSGLIVVAKNENVHEAIAEQFRNREVYKSYVALVHGLMRENTGKIDMPLTRDPRNRLKMAVQTGGRNALSLWKVRQRFERFTLLDVEIKTGRTHQIRVHLAYKNNPVVGDETYNEGRDKTVADVNIRQAIVNLNRFFLHAEKLSFTHPKTSEKMNFYAPLAMELNEFLKVLKNA